MAPVMRFVSASSLHPSPRTRSGVHRAARERCPIEPFPSPQSGPRNTSGVTGCDWEAADSSERPHDRLAQPGPALSPKLGCRSGLVNGIHLGGRSGRLRSKHVPHALGDAHHRVNCTHRSSSMSGFGRKPRSTGDGRPRWTGVKPMLRNAGGVTSI